MKRKTPKRRMKKRVRITALVMAALMFASTFGSSENMRVFAEEEIGSSRTQTEMQAGAQAEDSPDSRTDDEIQTLSEDSADDEVTGNIEGQSVDQIQTSSQSDSQNQILDSGQNETDSQTLEEEQNQTDSQTPAEGQFQSDDQSDGETPETVPLNVLRTSFVQEQRDSRQTEEVDIYQYAEENETFDINGGNPVKFAGGDINADTAPAYDSQDNTRAPRTFSYAGFVYQYEDGVGGTVPIRISGLFPYNGEWYYTLDENTEDINGISVGYRLTGSYQIRFYYALSDNTYYQITTDVPDGEEDHWNVSIDAEKESSARWGTQVTVEVDLPSKYAYGYVKVTTGSGYQYTVGLTRHADANNGEIPAENSYDENLISDNVENAHYTVHFTMPGENTTVTFQGVAWLTNRALNYGVAVNEGNAAQTAMYGITRIYTTKVGNKNTDPILLESNASEASIGEHAERTNNGTGSSVMDDDRSAWGVSLTGFNSSVANSSSAFYKAYDRYGMDTAGGGAYHSIENYYNGKDYNGWVKATGTYRETILRSNYSGEALGRSFDEVIYGNAYNNVGGAAKIGVENGQYKGAIANGKFRPGETVELMVETNRGLYQISGGNLVYEWRYIPASIWVDVYRGKNQWKTDNYVRESYPLPTGQNAKEVTYEHPMGGTITITPVAINQQEYTISDGTGSTRNLSRAYSRVNGTSGNDRSVSMGVYAYKITVSGMNNAFKVIYNGHQSSQRRFTLGSTTGVELPDIVSSGSDASQVNGSYIKRPSGNYQSLAVGTNWFGNGGNSVIVTFGIKPQEGYTVPAASLTNPNGASIQKTPTSNTPDAQGRYTYRLTEGTGANSGVGNDPTQVNFEGKPIDFPVVYYDTDGRSELSNGTTLSYAGQTNATVRYIAPEQVPEGEFFTGYKLEIRNAGGKTIATVAQNDLGDLVDSNGSAAADQWQQNDIINVKKVYQFLSTKGLLDQSNETYTIALVARTDADNRALANVGYSIYTQPGWLDDTKASYQAGKSIYEDTAFKSVTGTFSGYIGSEVILTGYDTERMDETGNYILDTYGSKLGDVIANPSDNGEIQEVGYLYYLKSTKAQIYVPQELADLSGFDSAEALIGQWNAANSDKNYTSISGRDDSYVYVNGSGNSGTALSLPGSVIINGVERKFAGWKIVDTTGGEPQEGLTTDELTLYSYTSGTGSLVGGNYIPSSISLYELAKASGGQEAWNDIFGNGDIAGTGKLLLVPYYEASYGAIGSASETERTAQTHTGESFSVSATFIYSEDNGTWEGHRNALRIAIYRDASNSRNKKWGQAVYNPNTDTWAVTPVKGNAGNKLSTTVQVVDNGFDPEESANTFTVTFQIINVQQGTGDSVRYAWEDSRSDNATTYKIYAWTDVNSKSEITAEDGKPPGDEVPSYTNKVNVKPAKIETDMASGGSHGDETSEGVYHSTMPEQTASAGEDLTISAIFSGDKLYPNTLQSGNSAIEEGKLRIALYRKNVSDPEWQLWATEEGAVEDGLDNGIAKVETPEVNIQHGNSTQGLVTVRFVLKGAYITGDDFEYCIAAWNNTNTDGKTITADSFRPSDTSGNYMKIPSVRSTVKPGWKSVDIYVMIPQTIVLSGENAYLGKGNDTTGYVGNSGYVKLRSFFEDGTEITSYPRIQISTAKSFGIANTTDSRDTLTVGVYSAEGGTLPADPSRAEHILIGTLDEGAGTKELTYQLNAKLPTTIPNGTQYIGSMTYHFDNLDETD